MYRTAAKKLIKRPLPPVRRVKRDEPRVMARMRKVHVTTGVDWVEVPEVGLYVLCGCPADAVKHLMRRGLIVETERGGVKFETGPNAILLSDVMLQNGTFCNLGEFPVLQMLYRQGMLIPGHPNNKGDKPLLIGLPEQVETQLRYIHRGNYGLVSKKEMIEAGASTELADELMAMKLCFAFGHIAPPSELVDAMHLAEAPVTLRGGVTLRRLGLNRFEFAWQGEILNVDLNLPPSQPYPSPYPLGKHTVDREYFSIIHTGDGDGWDQNRPCMGSMVMFQGRVYLIDAGPNLQQSLTALGISVNEVDGLFHTHCHDDHFAGLTALLHADRRIKYYATPLVRASVAKKFAALLSADEEIFPHCFDPVDLVADQWNDIEGLEVKPIISPHPVENTCFLFRAPWNGTYRSYAHLADTVSLEVLAGMVTDSRETGISRTFFEKVAADYAIPADVKKIDIGGGMIHGVVEDFRYDVSGKIVLAHTARQLTIGEMEVGSGSPFGAIDVIISGDNHFAWRNAFEGLRTCFPDTAHHELRMLLNSPLVVYNPETILLREGQQVGDIFLVVTGTVEMFRTGSLINGQLSAGALIGDAASIRRDPANKTYRAASFVQALKISSDLFRQFAERNELVETVLSIDECREFLRSTWICSEALTQTNLNRLAKRMKQLRYFAGDQIDLDNNLAFIRTGKVEISIGGEIVEVLQSGDFFGEEATVLEAPAQVRVRALEPTMLYVPDPATVRDVPVMRWRLLEGYRKRVQSRALLQPGE